MQRLADVERDIVKAAVKYGLDYLLKVDIAVVYNPNSRSAAAARIWGLHKIFQVAYSMRPAYVIELLPRFAALNCPEKLKVVVHELAHIPKSASGYLRPHNRAFWRDYKSLLKLFSCRDFTSLALELNIEK